MARPDAIAAVLGFVVTGSLVTANITNRASAFRILIPRRGDHGGCGVAAVEAARHPPVAAHPRPLVVGKPAPAGHLIAPPSRLRRVLPCLCPPAARDRQPAADPHGVYADYLLSGQPFIFLSEEWRDRVAAEHAELWRALPSGSSISG